ncbi:MAG: NAD-dependent epimerase/dehydratase family protein [Rhodobacteraceae bacterium]|nr:NAD-dependent epimerase/dehydratase family protein [Paracoccaceae bacterium]
MTVRSVLITGGNGNLGHLLADRFENTGIRVISYDIVEPQRPVPSRNIILGDIRDTDKLRTIFEKERPEAVVHLAGVLSGSSEADPMAAWEINATASVKLMQMAEAHNVGPFVFSSTVASYGPEVPAELPAETPQWPQNVYGATKIATERMGNWMKTKRGFDFRCLRFPMVISPFAPQGAVTAYPGHACLAAKSGKPFAFPVKAETGMSTLYLMDVVRSLEEFTLCEKSCVKQPAYNLHAYHFTAGMLAQTLENRFPGAKFTFDPQEPADSMIANWPDIIQDTHAREDWGWRHRYDFNDTIDALLETIN